MKTNIIAPTREAWILRRIARLFQKHLADCKVSRRPSDDADVNFYVNYGLFAGKTARIGQWPARIIRNTTQKT